MACCKFRANRAGFAHAEVSIGYTTIEALDAALPATLYQRAPLPWEAGFLAGKSFLLYRLRGGLRTSPLPDFYIGAHAAIGHLALLTRDAAHYRSYTLVSSVFHHQVCVGCASLVSG